MVMFAALNFKRLISGSVLIVVCTLPILGYANEKDEKSEKMRQKLEQLFEWRVSDRLQFSPDEEIKFKDEFKKFSVQKTKLTQELDALIDQIEKKKGDEKSIPKLLNAYEDNLRKGNELQLREIQAMKRMFGNKRLVEYVLLKREMTQKFKDVLTQNSMQAKASGGPVLKEPEVIQEK